jgi:hypothetical protein
MAAIFPNKAPGVGGGETPVLRCARHEGQRPGGRVPWVPVSRATRGWTAGCILPQAWVEDEAYAERRKACRVPVDSACTTQPMLGGR